MIFPRVVRPPRMATYGGDASPFSVALGFGVGVNLAVSTPSWRPEAASVRCVSRNLVCQSASDQV